MTNNVKLNLHKTAVIEPVCLFASADEFQKVGRKDKKKHSHSKKRGSKPENQRIFPTYADLVTYLNGAAKRNEQIELLKNMQMDEIMAMFNKRRVEVKLYDIMKTPPKQK